MIRWFLFFLTLSSTAFCQLTIEGTIIDSETGKPISFASIGIVGTLKGTSSNLNGQFSLSVSEPVSLKITCVGYESLVIKPTKDNHLAYLLKPIATHLNAIVVFNKPINPKKIVRKAFASIHENYTVQPFIQKFFYRHYCKDDSVYGRLVEASVDVWKDQGYRSFQKSAGDKEEIRVTHLRRSLDKTIMAEGHEPISIGNVLQADVVAYQTVATSEHASFYSEVSNLKTNFENYLFTFNGITTYDGLEVYEINYLYKKDSALTTTGKYMDLPQASGSLFITTDTYTFIKTEDVNHFGGNTIRTSAYYRKFNDKYYPYHFIREGKSILSENSTHSFRIDLMSVEISNSVTEKFVGHQPNREELLNIPYDSAFWSNHTILKTTPLEDKIIHDLGGGTSLDKQFYLYHQYEMNIRDGGKNGEQKFNWLKEYCIGKRILYLVFWSGNFQPYLAELEHAKRLNKQYRKKITFIFLSLEEDEIKWKQAIEKYSFFSDGIINYRIGKNSKIMKFFAVKETPAFVLLSRNGDIVDKNSKSPSDPLLEEDFKKLMEQFN